MVVRLRYDYRGKDSMPRGIRNNNPGNIRNVGGGKNNWKGKVNLEDNRDGVRLKGGKFMIRKEFEQFKSMEFGIRAMTVLIRNYIKRYGLDTIEKIIPVYAPAVENNVEAYIKHVVRMSKIRRDAVIDYRDKETLYSLIRAMCFHENGKHAVNPTIWEMAWNML
jgi:hypothetical protein